MAVDPSLSVVAAVSVQDCGPARRYQRKRAAQNTTMQTLELHEQRNRNHAHGEVDALMAEVHDLVARRIGAGRASVDEALPAVAVLQVATANVDACDPSCPMGIAGVLVDVADARMRLLRDSLERSLVYTAEATMRRLLDED